MNIYEETKEVLGGNLRDFETFYNAYWVVSKVWHKEQPKQKNIVMIEYYKLGGK